MKVIKRFRQFLQSDLMLKLYNTRISNFKYGTWVGRLVLDRIGDVTIQTLMPLYLSWIRPILNAATYLINLEPGYVSLISNCSASAMCCLTARKLSGDTEIESIPVATRNRANSG